MTATVSLQSIASLEGLRNALSRFAGEASESLAAVAREILRRQDELTDQKSVCRMRLQRLQAEVDDLTGDDLDDPESDDRLSRARRELEEAEDAMGEIVRCTRQLEDAAEEHARAARRLSVVLEENVPRGSEQLRRSIETLHSYLAMATPSGRALPSASMGASAPSTKAWGPTGETVSSRTGLQLEYWSFAGARGEDFDWQGEDFPAAFASDVHHGNTPDVYRGWVRLAFEVARRVAAGGWEAVAADPSACQVRDVFLGSEPPRLIIPAGGSRPIVGARHRVMAAIEAGATIPVLVERSSPSGGPS